MLSLGTAKMDITPPKGVEFNGYVTGNRSAGTWKNIYARALALDDGRTRLVLIATELMAISEDHVADMRREVIRKNPGLRPDQIMICAVHAHATPVTVTNYYSQTGGHKTYLRRLKRTMGTLVAEAVGNLEPVRMGAGEGWANININRRLPTDQGVQFLPNPKGVCDKTVSVFRFDRLDGRPKAVLFHYTCHPTTMGGDWVHGDYCGIACESVEERLGPEATVVFINGACGDIRPMVNRRSARTFGGGTREAVIKLGNIVGREVYRVARSIRARSDSVVLKNAVREVRFPFETPRSPEWFRQEMARLRATIRAFRKEGKPEAFVVEKRGELYGARCVYRLVTAANFRPWLAAEMQVFRIGNVILAGFPGEVFCDYGQAVRKICGRAKGLVVGFANGYIGYIPTAKALREGGYETDIAYRSFSNLPARFSERTERVLLDGLDALRRKVMRA